jgi:hypothetical protein
MARIASGAAPEGPAEADGLCGDRRLLGSLYPYDGDDADLADPFQHFAHVDPPYAS